MACDQRKNGPSAGPKRPENTGAAFERRVDSIFRSEGFGSGDKEEERLHNDLQTKGGGRR
jgi:hypothetical protein